MFPNYQARSPFVLKHTTSLLASERSERDTYRGNTIENRGCLFIYLFIYMFGRMYVILYVDPPYFCVRSAFDPVPIFTKQNPRV